MYKECFVLLFGLLGRDIPFPVEFAAAETISHGSELQEM